jgi:UPF0755 protein
MPPTPISLVGREAIHAALNPVAGSSLYFVARGDGSHVFSADLDAHNAAVREFQLKRRADYRSSPAPVSAEPAAAAPTAPTPTVKPATPAEPTPPVAPDTATNPESAQGAESAPEDAAPQSEQSPK